MKKMTVKGKVVWVSGPAVKADGMSDAQMYEMVEVGEDRMIGEIIRVTGDVEYSMHIFVSMQDAHGDPVGYGAFGLVD